MVITSTIGNRVAVMSGTWVQIPPSPPNKKTSQLRGFLFCKNGRMKPRAAPAGGGRARPRPGDEAGSAKEWKEHSEFEQLDCEG